jgi:hypothetical protein
MLLKRFSFRKVTQAALIVLLLLLPTSVLAGDFDRYPARSYSDRVNVYLHDGDRGPVHHTGPDFGPDSDSSSCFPHCGGGISGPFRNPNPDARKPENLTACIYDATDTLVYEREGKVCPYKYVDQNQIRVERRRREWLKSQAQ